MNKLLMTLLLGMFMISFGSATECWGTFEKDSDIELIQRCPSCSYVNITSITYPNGTTIFMNNAMTQTGVNYNYTLSDSSQIGIINYGVIGDKNGVSTPAYEDLCIEITKFGNVLSFSGAIIRIMLLVFMCFLVFGYSRLSQKINFDKWYANILRKYEDKNYIKSNFAFVLYSLAKGSFMIYYLLVFVIILLLSDIILMFNVTALVTIIEKVVMLYSLGIIAVGFLFIGKAQEMVFNLVEDIKNANWGMGGNE